METVRQFLKEHPKASMTAGLVASLLLYFVGVRFILVLTMCVACILFFPLPKILSSWFSKLIASICFVIVIIQLAASVQFLILPRSGFNIVAILSAIILCGFIGYFGSLQKPPKIFSKYDVGACIVGLIFLLPFGLMLSCSRPIEKVAQISGFQAIDSINHEAFIVDMTNQGHLDVNIRIYYPKTFHLAVGFLEQPFIGKQTDLSWSTRAYIYLGQYLLFGVLMSISLYYLCLSWYRQLRDNTTESSIDWLAIALSLGVPLALLFGWPFVDHGFLNFTFATTLLAFTFLLFGESSKLQKNIQTDRITLSKKAANSISLGVFLLFGVSSTWPLLLLPALVTAALLYLPRKISLRTIKDFISKPELALIVMVAIQALPFFIQHQYSIYHPNLGIALTGDLRSIHALVLVSGVFVVAYLLLNPTITDYFKRTVFAIFLPTYIFNGLFLLAQYFLYGEARYYAIKCSIILELLLLILTVALVLRVAVEAGFKNWYQVLMLSIFPLLFFLMLMGGIENPLKPSRDLLRDFSGQGRPQYFNEDLNQLIILGTNNKLSHFNAAVLHYEKSSGKLVAHGENAYWAGLMNYQGPKDWKAQDCHNVLYELLSYGVGAPEEKEKIISKTKECIDIAHQQGQDYYIVTDRDSVESLQEIFGSSANYVY